LEDLSLDRRRTLRWIFKKWDVRVSSGCMWFGIWTRYGLL